MGPFCVTAAAQKEEFEDRINSWGSSVKAEGANFNKSESLWILFMGIIKYFHTSERNTLERSWLFCFKTSVLRLAKSKSLTPSCQFFHWQPINHAWDCAFSWRGVLVRRQIYKSLSNQGTGNGKLLRSWKQLADDPKAFASSCHILEPSLAGRCLLKLSRGRTASISTRPLGFLFDCCRPKSPQNCLGRHHCPRRHFLGRSRHHCLVHHLPNTWNERAVKWAFPRRGSVLKWTRATLSSLC